MYKLFFKILLIVTLSHACGSATINVIKKENKDTSNTLLVIAGIHGDEPGGYFAASILATHYTIKSKNVWIIPNLNKDSIRADVRGINGDMNRKFSYTEKNDKDKEIIEEVKKIILSKNISLIVNLHDGHGFYRKKDAGSVFNPNAWGQTCVIDQCKPIQNQPFGNLDAISSRVKEKINKNLIEPHHSFDVKNTNTKFDDEMMRLSLTYFAVTNNKPAFAIESSKNLSSVSQKVYYQLLALEEFMKIMDISFTKDFELKEKEISKLINDYGTVAINENILLNFNDIKKNLAYIPLKQKENQFKFSHPLADFKKIDDTYVINIGNKQMTILKPEFIGISDSCPKKIDVEIDGKITSINKSSDFFVNDDFKILEHKNMRVNIIGFTPKNNSSESGVKVNLKALNKNFSVDTNGKVYRVEFYKGNDFCFMSMVHFK